MSMRSAIRQLNSLARLGYIKIIHKIENNSFLANQYDLHLPPKHLVNNHDGVFTALADINKPSPQQTVNDPSPPPINGSNAPFGGAEAAPEPVMETLQLTQDEEICFAWALQSMFWSGLVTSKAKFLDLYRNGSPYGLKIQFWNEQNKLRVTGGKDAKNRGYGSDKAKPGTPAEQVARAAGYDTS